MIGSIIFWKDPDNGFSSGFYRVDDIYSESKTIESDDTILFVTNEHGTELEIFAHEVDYANN